MHWVIDVYVSAWARIRSLHLLVARSIVTAAKSCMNCLLGHDLILYIVLLVFLVVVLAGARVVPGRVLLVLDVDGGLEHLARLLRGHD